VLSTRRNRIGSQGGRSSRLVIGVTVVAVAAGALALSSGAAIAAPNATQHARTSASAQYDVAKVIKPKATKPMVKGASQTVNTSSTSTPVSANTAGNLPFTGMSLAGVVVVGFGMIGVGVLLVRRKRDHT
jgi:hypothetical protein